MLDRASTGLCVIAALTCSACGPKVDTQAHRYQYLKGYIDQAADLALNCKQSSVTFLESSRVGVAEFDHYQIEGCDQSTEMMTSVTVVDARSSTVFVRRIMAVPPLEKFPTEAREQLAPTARFALDCTELAFQDLAVTVTPMREVYTASIGVTGCGRKATYKVVCQYTGFNAGQHGITCASTAEGAPPAP